MNNQAENTHKEEFIFKDLSFHPISELLGDTKMIEEFVVNYIIPHNHNYFKSKLLKNLGSSDLWILYTKPCYKNVLRPGEKWWDSFMSNDMFDTFNTHNGIILGFMLITESNSKKRSYNFIDLIDTRLSGFNLSIKMIRKYERIYKKKLYIQSHTKQSSSFWLNYFKKSNKLKDFKKLIKNNEKLELYLSPKHTYINPPNYSHMIFI